jgi:hypothetical protein
MLGPGAVVSLHACYAASGNAAYPSIAQLIANRLQVKVYASLGGSFFGVDPNATAILPLQKQPAPAEPIYLIPNPGKHCWISNPYPFAGQFCSALP